MYLIQVKSTSRTVTNEYITYANEISKFKKLIYPDYVHKIMFFYSKTKVRKINLIEIGDPLD